MVYNPESAKISGIDSVIVESGEGDDYLIDSSEGTFLQIFEFLEAKELSISNLVVREGSNMCGAVSGFSMELVFSSELKSE